MLTTNFSILLEQNVEFWVANSWKLASSHLLFPPLRHGDIQHQYKKPSVANYYSTLYGAIGHAHAEVSNSFSVSFM